MMLGTLSGNPVAAAAGLKTMEILRRPGSYEKLFEIGERLMGTFSHHLSANGVAHRVVGHPTLFDIQFIDRDVRDYRDVFAADAKRNAAFNKVLRAHGVFKSPGKVYPCLALTEDDLALTEEAIAKASKAITEN
jgi:glutamate-1-semialdehyde 2,1-aminomutase